MMDTEGSMGAYLRDLLREINGDGYTIQPIPMSGQSRSHVTRPYSPMMSSLPLSGQSIHSKHQSIHAHIPEPMHPV